jgi:hypothetical protein
MTLRPGLLLPLACAVLGAACYAKKADGNHGPMSGSGLPVPDGGGLPDGAVAGTVDGAPAVADGNASGDGGHAGDLAADRGPSAQVMAYTQFLDEQWKAWSARWVTCFNAAPEALSPGRSPLYDDTPDQHTYSLEHGLAVLDQTRARACLDALRTMSCEWLAGEEFRAVCVQALVGKVASGGFCASPEDCESANEVCLQKDMHGCISRCSPRPARAALGELCADRPCAAGGYCYTMPGSTEARCYALAAEGASCPDRFACVAGRWCQPAAPGADQGTCRALGAGLACQGSWQCHYAYACVTAPGSAAGTCQPGRKKGEACSLHGKELSGGPYSDCANGLFCYPDASNQYRCGVGHEAGEACADLDVGGMNPLSVPCRAGSCRPGPGGQPTCQPDQKAGAACGNELPCELGLGCIAGVCTDPIVGVGQRCASDGTYACTWGARCALSPVSPTQGMCVRLRMIGESCAGLDDCEPGAACAGGSCVGCK